MNMVDSIDDILRQNQLPNQIPKTYSSDNLDLVSQVVTNKKLMEF
jgi:hypothetical protein